MKLLEVLYPQGAVLQLTLSFQHLRTNFSPVFTAPTSLTCLLLLIGWLLSQRHRFSTEIVFSGNQVGCGHDRMVPFFAIDFVEVKKVRSTNRAPLRSLKGNGSLVGEPV